MAKQQRGWKQFQKLNLDRKRFSKRVKKAETATVRHARKFIVGRLDNIRHVRRQIIGWSILVGCLLTLVGVQMMWLQSGYQTKTAAAGGTYAEASIGPIETLNPLYATSSAETITSRLLFSSLYRYDETGHLRGDLATSMKVDSTGMIYTIKLRENATWHDGKQLTARDVAFTVNLIKNPQTRSPLQMEWRDIGVKVVDDYTIQFTLPAIYAPFSHALTFAVLPQHILGDVAPGAIRESTYSRSPIGSGPFQLRLLQTVNVKKQQKVVNLAAYNKYYKGAPLIGRFEVHSYANQADIAAALAAGEVNAAADLDGTEVVKLDQARYTVLSRPVNSGVYALMNTTSDVLKDKKVRQALQHATDTEVVRKSLALPAPTLDLPFITGQLTGDDVPTAPKPNNKEAEKLLDDAGWKRQADGRRMKDGKALTISMVSTKNTDYEKVLQVLAGQWRNLGVRVDTQIVDPTDKQVNFARNILQQRQYDVFVAELAIGGDPDVYVHWHSSRASMGGLNLSNYSNAAADLALSTARSSLDTELRNVKYKSFARQWLADAPAIGLYQPTSQYVYNKHAMTIQPSERLVSPYDRYTNILYWSVSEKSVYKTP